MCLSEGANVVVVVVVVVCFHQFASLNTTGQDCLTALRKKEGRGTSIHVLSTSY